jgi:hypothetical protein
VPGWFRCLSTPGSQAQCSLYSACSLREKTLLSYHPGYSCPSCLHLAPTAGISAKLVCNFHVLCSSQRPPAHVGWLEILIVVQDCVNHECDFECASASSIVVQEAAGGFPSRLSKVREHGPLSSRGRSTSGTEPLTSCYLCACSPRVIHNSQNTKQFISSLPEAGGCTSRAVHLATNRPFCHLASWRNCMSDLQPSARSTPSCGVGHRTNSAGHRTPSLLAHLPLTFSIALQSTSHLLLTTRERVIVCDRGAGVQLSMPQRISQQAARLDRSNLAFVGVGRHIRKRPLASWRASPSNTCSSSEHRLTELSRTHAIPPGPQHNVGYYPA